MLSANDVRNGTVVRRRRSLGDVYLSGMDVSEQIPSRLSWVSIGSVLFSALVCLTLGVLMATRYQSEWDGSGDALWLVGAGVAGGLNLGVALERIRQRVRIHRRRAS